MNHVIKKYPVHNPVLKNYIKFFWELKIPDIELSHKIIPQRNINLRFNLSSTSQYLIRDGKDTKLENVFFTGLQDRYTDSVIQLNGEVDTIGICFLPEGFYAFSKIPVGEFRNISVGTGEIGIKQMDNLVDKLKSTNDSYRRMNILENELLKILGGINMVPKEFKVLFNKLNGCNNLSRISEFCKDNNLNERKLERLFHKYIGISAKSFYTLNRFQNSLNQILYQDYSRLVDIAYDNGYFDQMHFIKEFKRFAGNTPKKFLDQKKSLLQIGKFK